MEPQASPPVSGDMKKRAQDAVVAKFTSRGNEKSGTSINSNNEQVRTYGDLGYNQSHISSRYF